MQRPVVLKWWKDDTLPYKAAPPTSSPVLKAQLLLPPTASSIVAKWDEWKGKRAHNPSLIPHREGPWLYSQLSTERKVKKGGGGSWKLEAEERKEGIISRISSSSNWLLAPSGSFTASLILCSPQSCSSSILQLSSGSCVPPLASNSPTLPEVSAFKNLQLSQQWIQVEETHICQPWKRLGRGACSQRSSNFKSCSMWWKGTMEMWEIISRCVTAKIICEYVVVMDCDPCNDCNHHVYVLLWQNVL